MVRSGPRRHHQLLKAASLAAGLCLGACVMTRPPAPVTIPVGWEMRMPALQQAGRWALDGRAGASIGKQGWQASLAWSQQGSTSELRLTGPLGIGASLVRLSPDGLSIDGATASDGAAGILHDRLGVDLPLGSLRFWLLGVPDPGETSTVTRNAHERAQQLIQSGWTVDINRYMPVQGDWLPAQLTVQRDDVRLRIAIDQWDFPR